MKTLATLLLLLPLATACASGPSKSELDAEVKRLCAIDGGIKVYERVALPEEKFVGYKSGKRVSRILCKRDFITAEASGLQTG